MDMQELVLGFVEDPDVVVERTRMAIAAARRGGVPVLFVVVRFRPGHPEISPRNRAFAAVAEGGLSLGESDPAAQIVPALEPRDGEPVVVKRRVSAFAGSDLDVLLRAGSIGHLVLAGIATSGVVLSTLRQAADLDYRLTVLGDCCADRDPEVHRILLERVFPSQADVVPATEWAAGLGGR